MGKYVLIGIPNSGKTAIGKRAAEKLGISYYDSKTVATERLTFNEENPLTFLKGMDRVMKEHVNVLSDFAKQDEPAIIEVWADFSKAIELEPDKAQYYADRRDAYYEVGNFTAGLSDFSEMFRLNPNSV